MFNHTVGVDVNYIHDCDGTEIMLFNIVCLGTGIQIEVVLREGTGTPSSLECLDAFMQYWVSWAGFPKEVITDRGLNNRGVYAKELAAAGVITTSIGLEAPYQLGKVERHGAIWKTVAGKVIETRNISGMRAMMIVAAETNPVVNQMNRVGGFAPAQWVLGRTPRYGAGELGDDEQEGQYGSLDRGED